MSNKCHLQFEKISVVALEGDAAHPSITVDQVGYREGEEVPT